MFSQREVIARGQDFDLYFANGESLCFQHLNVPMLLTINVVAGTLNGTNGDLFIESGGVELRGDLSFTSQESASLHLSCDNGDVHLLVNGQAYAGTFSIQASQSVHIQWVLAWDIYIWTLPILGCVGAFCVVASPYYIVTQLRKKTGEAFLNAWMYGLILFFIGLGLVIAWLWS